MSKLIKSLTKEEQKMVNMILEIGETLELPYKEVLELIERALEKKEE